MSTIGESDALYVIDAEGSAAPDWHQLAELAAEAADQVAKSLLPQPELFARYGLDRLVKALTDAAEDRNAAAILLLVPVLGSPSGLPTINGTYPLRHVRHFQRLSVPSAWIKQQLSSTLLPPQSERSATR